VGGGGFPNALFEFKAIELETKDRALLLQIKGCALLRHRSMTTAMPTPHSAAGQPIYLIGIEFSREQRRVLGFEGEILEPPAKNRIEFNAMGASP